MKTFVFGVAAAMAVTLTAAPVFAQGSVPAGQAAEGSASPSSERGQTNQGQKSGSENTGGDAKPSAVDPAQAHKTGANAGEGASYNRSNEKGDSTMKDDSSPQGRTR